MFIELIFTRMPGDSYHMRFISELSCPLLYVWRQEQKWLPTLWRRKKNQNRTLKSKRTLCNSAIQDKLYCVVKIKSEFFFYNLKISFFCAFLTLALGAQDQRLGAGQNELPCWPTEEKKPLLSTVKRRKLEWVGHVTRHDFLSKSVPSVVELIYLVFTRKPGDGYHRRFSLSRCVRCYTCDVGRALLLPFVCGVYPKEMSSITAECGRWCYPKGESTCSHKRTVTGPKNESTSSQKRSLIGLASKSTASHNRPLVVSTTGDFSCSHGRVLTGQTVDPTISHDLSWPNRPRSGMWLGWAILHWKLTSASVAAYHWDYARCIRNDDVGLRLLCVSELPVGWMNLKRMMFSKSRLKTKIIAKLPRKITQKIQFCHFKKR